MQNVPLLAVACESQSLWTEKAKPLCLRPRKGTAVEGRTRPGGLASSDCRDTLQPLRPRSMEYGATNWMLRMIRIHPNRCRTATAIGIFVAFSCAGCQSQQTALTNPFMAPDRVPPPATRVVAPGAAQPYYPGDPLPASHASAATPNPTVAAAAAPAPNAAPAPASPPSALAFSNERTVSVPADDSSLRFALPSPPPATNVASSPAPSQPPAPPTAPPTQSQVIPASYAGPDPNLRTPGSVTDTTPTSPWRSPQVPATIASAPVNTAPQSFAATTAPQAAPSVAAATIPVTMRAVPSPAADVAVTQPPRIRFPSYDSAPQIATSGNPVQQAAFAAPPMNIAQQPLPQPGVPQTLAITEIQPTGAVPGLGPATMPTMSIAAQPQSPAPTVVSPDGFRPRSAMR
jgi:hypothetical protein